MNSQSMLPTYPCTTYLGVVDVELVGLTLAQHVQLLVEYCQPVDCVRRLERRNQLHVCTPHNVELDWNWSKVLRHKMGHFGDVLLSQSLGSVLKATTWKFARQVAAVLTATGRIVAAT